ncbi:MAG: hypothetical protein WAV90_00380 [Gordonia amarae]
MAQKTDTTASKLQVGDVFDYRIGEHLFACTVTGPVTDNPGGFQQVLVPCSVSQIEPASADSRPHTFTVTRDLYIGPLGLSQP